MGLKRKSTLTFILFVLLSALFILSAATAEEAYLRIWGRGFGHGVGMCQWGAYGLSKQGRKYGEIIRYYFSGVSVSRYSESTPTVKVLIREFSDCAEVTGTPYLDVINEQTGGYILKQFPGGVKVEKHDTGTSVIFKIYRWENNSYQPVGTFTGPIRVTAPTSVSYFEPSSSGKVRYDYKGFFRFVANSSKKTVYLVNHVDLESYVYGIAEMPSSWPLEALKAQAVAARTYAYLRIKPGSIYDLTDDQSSQVYIGLNKINSSYGLNWKEACDLTRREIVYYGSRVASVYYHSTCGGHTENSEDVWLTAYPEDRGVPCSYCSESKYFTWETTVSLSALRTAFNDSGIVYAQVKSRTKDRRADRVLLFKSNGQTLEVSGSTFRSKLGLRSTWFYISAERIAGISRYETNQVSSQRTFTSAPAAVIVNGRSYPDGISAAPLAGCYSGPVLLTEKDLLKATAASELKRLRPSRVFVVGGTGAVSTVVEEELKSLLPDALVVRIGGKDRYETNSGIIAALFSSGSTADCAFIVTGRNFPDAISVSGIAYMLKAPVVLTDGYSIRPQTKELLLKKGIRKVFLIGGEGVVSRSLEESLKGEFGEENVIRWAGSDRYETAYRVATESLKLFSIMDREGCVVATGEDFADAISASFFCGRRSYPLVLTKSSTGSEWARRFVSEKRPVNRFIFGGTGAVSLSAETQIFSY